MRAEQSRAEQSRAEQSRAEQRLDYLDIAKGIGITLVVFGHLSQSSEISRILVYSFHMPLFFLISGYLNKGTRTLQRLKKNAISLLPPVYIILIVDVLISMLQCILGMDPWPDKKAIFETLILYKGLWKNYPIWFLMTLFVCELFLVIFGKKVSYLVALICTGCCILNLNGVLPAFWLFTTISALPFFTAGVFVREHRLPHFGKIIHAVIFVLWLVIAIVNGPVDMYQGDNGKSWILFAVSGLLGTYVTICISKWIEKRENRATILFSTIGKNTMAILLTHYYICRIILPKVMRGLHHEEIYNSFVFQILVTCVLMGVYFYLFKRRRERVQ